MTKVVKYVLIAFAGLIVLNLSGPTPSKPRIDTTLPTVDSNIQFLAAQIVDFESHVVDLKVDNQARIVWADSTKKQKTPFSVVYLHGFGSSQGDGFPIQREFLRRYSCNLYLARLYGHGIESQNLLQDLTPENYLESAQRAVSIGKILGDKVIVMATSTGATLALIIAS